MWDVADKAYVSYGNTAQYSDGITCFPGLRVFNLLVGGYKDIDFPLLTEGTLTQHFQPGSILATSDKKHIYVFQQGAILNNYVAEIDPATDTFVRYISAPAGSPHKFNSSFMAAISPDNKFIIAFNLQLFDLSTGAWIKTLWPELADTTDTQSKLISIFQYPFFDRPEFSLDGAKCYIPANITCKNSLGYASYSYPCVVETAIPSGGYGDPIIIKDVIGKSPMSSMSVTPTPVFSQAVHDTMLIPRSIVASENHPGRVYCFGNMNRLGNCTSRVVVLDFVNRTQEVYDTGNTATVGFPPFLAVLEKDALGADSGGAFILAHQSGAITEYVYNALTPVYTSPENNAGNGNLHKTAIGRFVVDYDLIYLDYQSPAPAGGYNLDILDRRSLVSSYVPHRLVTPDSPLFVYISGLNGHPTSDTRRKGDHVDMAQDHASGLITIVRSIGAA